MIVACPRIKHRLLELERLSDMLEAINAFLAGSQDLEVAEAANTAQEALIELNIVDFLEGGIEDALVEHAVELNDTPVGDNILLIGPMEVVKQGTQHDKSSE